jgi:hypothetical protein
MVISCVIKGFLIHNVLVDTGSAADIIFAKAFTQMQESDDKIHDATHPLCGFGGRQIVALDKITMPVTFGYVHNTRTEQVVFDIEYSYNAIIGRGTLNAFEAILHTSYLCMKIPLEQGPCWGPSSSEGPQKCNLTMFPKYDLWTCIFGFMVKADMMKSLIVTKVAVAPKLCRRELRLNRRKGNRLKREKAIQSS